MMSCLWLESGFPVRSGEMRDDGRGGGTAGSERDGGDPGDGDGLRRGPPDYFGRGGEVRERDEAGGGENGMNRKRVSQNIINEE